MSEFLQGLFAQTLLPILLTALAAIATWAIGKGAAWLEGKAQLVKLERIKVALEHLVDAAATAALETAQTAVDAIKLAASDGKLTPDEARAALEKAVNRAWQLLAPEIREILIGLFGSEQAAKAAAVTPTVEAAVRGLERPAKGVSPTPEELDALTRDARLARQRLGLLP